MSMSEEEREKKEKFKGPKFEAGWRAEYLCLEINCAAMPEQKTFVGASPAVCELEMKCSCGGMALVAHIWPWDSPRAQQG